MYHTYPIETVYKKLKTSEKGLTTEEADKRLHQYGLNEIKETVKISPLKILLSQFNNFLIYILIFAAAVSIIIGEVADSIVILVILILIGVIGFIQEFRAEKAIEALKKLASLTTKVIRDGNETQIDVLSIVPGDIIILETGDKIPADSRVIDVHHLETQESILTGESLPLKKDMKVLSENTPVAEQTNMLFSGTVVTGGRCRAVVVHTGMQTEIGKIAAMIQEVKQDPTPLQKRLEKLGKNLGLATIIICLIIFGIGIFTGREILEMFKISVSLAVAAVPEGLPAVVVVSLAIGAKKMVKRNALIRKLPSVETLGSTAVICSDKTGTLTKNEMTVKKIYANGKRIDVTGAGYQSVGDFMNDNNKIAVQELELLLTIGALNNNAVLRDGQVIGDPTEGALIACAEKAGLHKKNLEKDYPRIEEIEFTSERKLMTTVHNVNGKRVAYVKGAPEVLLNLCTSMYTDGNVKPLSKEERNKILEINSQLAENALRVLGFAFRTDLEKAEEKDLTFVGLQAMIDPPREEVKAAIDTCKKAGIKVVMITGDHEITAKAIASQLGIEGRSIQGKELETIRDLEQVVEGIAIYARVNPAHKLKIVEALKKKGYIVAMTGDGVNDAPALKKADIGTAMGIAGTDVAKEASEMILTDDNFASIVNAIEEGRTIFDNIKKFLALLLSGNIAEILIIFLAILIGFKDPETGVAVIPLLAIQILWINLITDGLPALALSVDPPEKGIMERAPRKPDESIFHGLAGFVYVYPVIMFLGVILIFAHMLSVDGVKKAQTMVFTSVIVYELFQAFSCRSLTRPSISVGLFKNKWLLGAVVLSILLHMGLIYIPFFQTIFNVTPLSLQEWLLITAVSSSGFIYLEIHKYFSMKKSR